MTAQRIAVDSFLRAEIAEDGRALRLVLVDAGGVTVVLSLPMRCLGELLAELPAGAEPPPGTVREVRAWRLDGGAEQAGLTLTLQTAEGQSSAFRVTPGQIAGMATLATYGGLSALTARTIN